MFLTFEYIIKTYAYASPYNTKRDEVCFERTLLQMTLEMKACVQLLTKTVLKAVSKDAVVFARAPLELQYDDEVALIAFSGKRSRVKRYLLIAESQHSIRRQDLARAFYEKARLKVETHDVVCGLSSFLTGSKKVTSIMEILL